MSMSVISSEHELDEFHSASVIVKETMTGSHRMKVVGYSLNKWIGYDECLPAAPFTFGGFDWNITTLYANPEENRIDLYFDLNLSKNTIAIAQVNFAILDQSGSPSTLVFNTVYTFGETNEPPCRFLVEGKTLEESNCLENDSFTMMCTITLVKRSTIAWTKFETIRVPPSNSKVQFLQLLESGNKADVIFHVSKEIFKAHKCILGARSPVFNAQFFGTMSKKEETDISLDDIIPAVFRVFLHFIYTDSVPDLNEDDPVPMYQHLLVAADRYGIQRLKSLCENELFERLEITNFATTLTLAEQHNCFALKASCFKFVSHHEILNEVIKTDGYEHLIQSCPYILKELVENLCTKR